MRRGLIHQTCLMNYKNNSSRINSTPTLKTIRYTLSVRLYTIYDIRYTQYEQRSIDENDKNEKNYRTYGFLEED